jgi:hypothetical protein
MKNDFDYTVYVQPDGSRHYYLTPLEWYRSPKPKRTAKLHMGDSIYPIDLQLGIVTKLVATDTLEAWSERETAETISIEDEYK